MAGLGSGGIVFRGHSVPGVIVSSVQRGQALGMMSLGVAREHQGRGLARWDPFGHPHLTAPGSPFRYTRLA